MLEWLAAVNMLSCAGDLLRDLKGSDLAGLDRDRLRGLGLKEEAAQEALLRCLAELCRPAAPAATTPTVPAGVHHQVRCCSLPSLGGGCNSLLLGRLQLR